MPLITPEFWEKVRMGVSNLRGSKSAKDLQNVLIGVKNEAQKVIPKPTKLDDDTMEGTFGTNTAPAPERKITWDYQDKESFPMGYRDYLTESADQYGIDPNILASLIASESGGAGYQPDLTGTSGEVGIAQIIPQFYYQQAGFGSPDEYAMALQDPAFAIEQAAVILSDLLNQYDDNYYDALASYNGGSAGYQNTGAGSQYASDTLNRIGLENQYQPGY